MKTTNIEEGTFIYECFACGYMYYSGNVMFFCPNCKEFDEFYLMD